MEVKNLILLHYFSSSYLDCFEGPSQNSLPLVYNEDIGGNTQARSLDCLPPPQLLEHWAHSDHSV